MNAWLELRRDAGPQAFWSWRLLAACRQVDSGIFFAPDGERANERDVREARAKAVCARCPVVAPCAAYAIEHGERYGVWGGLSERERAALRLRRRNVLVAVPAVWADPLTGSGPTGLQLS